MPKGIIADLADDRVYAGAGGNGVLNASKAALPPIRRAIARYRYQ